MFNFIVGFLSCFAVLAFIGYLRLRQKPQPTPPHTCQFAVIDAQELKNIASVMAGPMTIVLKRCSVCQEHKTILIPGTWPIDTLLLEEPRVIAEIAALRRMAK